MALKTFVKVSNITNLSDARYCAGMMVDILGFNLDPTSEKSLPLQDYNEISEWVSGVKYAGEFTNGTIEDIKEVLKHCDLNYIEVNQMELVEPVQLLGKAIIFRIEIGSASDFNKLKSTLSYLDELIAIAIIKCSDSTLYEKIDSFIAYYNGNVKLVRGYNIELDENLSKFPGLELEATEEERPGYKDYGKIMDVLEVLDED